MYTQFDIQGFAHITTSVADYFNLINRISHVNKSFYEEILKKYDLEYPNQYMIDDWKRINLHFVKQLWGNTSAGWETMGGAAMTEAYTLVIENLSLGIIAVYYLVN